MLNEIVLNALKELSPEDLTWIIEHGDEKLVSENEKIITEGEKVTKLYIVLSGLFSGAGNNEQCAIITPGGIIGGMSFFTKDESSLSFTAIEPNSRVLEIPYEIISDHLQNDPYFALRFYRFLAIKLSERMKNLINFSISRPHSKATKLSPNILGPVALFKNNQPNFELIKTLLNALPPLASVLNKNDYQALMQREHCLSVATMSADSIKLLLEIAKEEGVLDFERRVITHPASMSAADKQVLLADYHIQKTITILIQDKFVLCSGIGDFKIHHALLSKLASTLTLSHAGFNSYINPNMFIPEIELGLMRGMVSTFFSPGRITRLNLVTLMMPPQSSTKDVAISLSPFESLLLPYALFPKIVKKYAERAYPYLLYV